MKSNRLSIILFSLLFIWLIGITVFLSDNGDTNTKIEEETSKYIVTGFSTDFTKIVDESKSSMVMVEQNGEVSSGFIYASENNKIFVATTYHGVSKGENVNVTFNSGYKTSGVVKGYDIFVDCALVECDCNFEVKSAKLGDSLLLNDGEFILSIGTSGSSDYAFSSQFGMVSSSFRQIRNQINYDSNHYDYYLDMIQLSGEFNNGYSGSAILNMNGEVVGMITMEDDGVVLANTINEVRVIFDKIINEIEYNRFNFGICGKYVGELENYETVQLNIDLDVINGLYVSDVLDNSFAKNIGVLKGDVIVTINDVEIKNSSDMLNIIYSEYEEYNLTVIRNDDEVKLIGVIND